MVVRLSRKDVTALSLLLPIISAAPASARQDGDGFRMARPDRILPRDLHWAASGRSSRRANQLAVPIWNTPINPSPGSLAIPQISLQSLSQSNRQAQRSAINASNLSERSLHLSERASLRAANAELRLAERVSQRAANAALADARGPRRLELDLSSTDKIITLSSKLFRNRSWVTADVGGVNKIFSEGEKVTAAEYLAITQSLETGAQSLSLSGDGAASGGQFSLDLLKQPRPFRNITELVIPESVIAIDDLSRGALNISGDLINHGQILGVSSARGQQGKILAENIVNMAGAVISMDALIDRAGADSNSPDFVAGLVRLGQTVTSGTQLLISASESVVNSGTIFSAGNLTVSAPAICNHGVMFSGDSLAIESQRITNSGVVKSMGAAMTLLGTSAVEALNVINDGGKFDASHGNLFISAAAPIKVIGGAFNAQSVKLNTPYSTVNVAVDSISGFVDVIASMSAVHVATGDLAVNTISVTDDPIFTNSTGNITLPATITAAGAPVTAVAAGSIFGAGNGTVIDTSSLTGNGGEVILLAGVANNTANGITTVSGASGLSGSISGITSIKASGRDTASGGNITVGAFGGAIDISGSLLTDAKYGGRVLMLAPDGINVGDVSSRGAHERTDYVTIKTVDPTLAAALKFDQAGRLTQGSVGVGSTYGSGSIVTGNLESGVRGGNGADSGNINVQAGGSVTTGFLRAMGGGAPARGWALQGYDYGSNGGHGGNISVVAQGGAVTINGDVNSSGGGGGGANHTAGGTGGDGGNLLITALADVIINGPVLAPGGGGGGGVGISSTDTAGGGASLGNGGGPNSGGLFYAPPPYDGPGMLDNGLNPHNPNHPRFPYAGMGGTNTAYDIGCCGSGYGGDVGNYGENGDEGTFAPRGYWNDTTPKPGGAPGIGGNITISGRDIAVNNTIESYFPTVKDIDRSPYADFSIFTHSQRGGGQIKLTTSGGNVASTIYAGESDLESTTANVTAQLRAGQLSIAGRMRGDQVKLNNVSMATTITPGKYVGAGTGTLTITENGVSKVVSNGDLVTPAEWVALIQKGTTGSQALQLGEGGAANDGSFAVATPNIPVAGFSRLVVPLSVSADVSAPTLNAIVTNIKGDLNFSTDATLNASNLSLTGKIAAPDAVLTINAPQVNLAAGSQITAGGVTMRGSGGLNLNLTSGGNAAIINSTNASTVLGLAGQATSFSNTSGGPASLNFTGGPLDIIGTTFTNSSTVNLLFNNATTVTLTGADFTNQGSIKAVDAAGNGGSFAVTSSAANFAFKGGDLSVGASAGGGHGGNLSLAAQQGALTLNGGTLDASGAGAGDFDGGEISLLARSLTVIGSPLALTANGVGSGSGGSVSVITTASNSDLIVDGASGHLSISAHGGTAGSSAGDGGNIALSAGRNLTVSPGFVDLAPRGNNGAGGNIDLAAGTAGSGNLLFSGYLNAAGVGNGAGGNVRIAANSPSALVIGSTPTNGVAGGISAGGSAGGSISIENGGAGGIKIDDDSLLSATAATGAGGKLHLITPSGLLDMAAGIYSVNGGGANGKGGEVVVDAGTLAVTGAGGAHISANGGIQGDGGLIDVSVQQNLNLGSGSLSLSATGGSAGSSFGDGGRIELASGGNLSVGSGALDSKPLGNNGAGGDYRLTAGTAGGGTLLIDDTLDASGKGNGSGGDIDLNFAANQPFVVGGAGLTNGVSGSILANGNGTGGGGRVSIRNSTANALDVIVNSSIDTGSGITSLESTANVSLGVNGTFNSRFEAIGQRVDANNPSGSLVITGIDAGPGGVQLTGGPIDIEGSVFSDGDAVLHSSGVINVNASLHGTNVDIQSSALSGFVAARAAIAADNSVSISTAGASAIQFFTGGTVNAPTVDIETQQGEIVSIVAVPVLTATTLNISSAGGNIGTATQLLVTASNLAMNTSGSGVVNVKSAGTTQLNLLNSSSGGAFTLQASGPITVNDVLTEAGEISITTSSGRLDVAPGAEILAIDGDVNLRNNDFSGSIAIGANANIKGSSTTTGLGDIYIGFGPMPSTLPRPRKRFKNVTLVPLNGGSIHVSKGGLQAASPTNTLTAEGRKIVFQNATKKKRNAISLGGGVKIIADPPAQSVGQAGIGIAVALSAPSPVLKSRAVDVATSSFEQTSASGGSSVRNAGLSENTFNANAIVSSTNYLNSNDLNALGNSINLAPGGSSRTPANADDQRLNLISTNELQLATISDASQVLKLFSTYVANDAAEFESAQIGLWSHDDLLDGQSDSRSTVVSANSPSELELSLGAVVFAPAVDTTVNLPGVKLKLSARSVSLVVATSDAVSVYDLDDRHKQSVVIENGSERIALSPGQHLTIAPAALSFADVNPLESIPHRALFSSKSKNGNAVFMSEFSLFAAMEGVVPLRQILKSKHQRSQRISSSLVKTAAVVMQLRGTSDFQTHSRTQLAAWQH
jgi:hypothetical protein